MSYSKTAGHLSVLRGNPILTDIDWEAGHVEPDQTIEDLVTKPNLLHNMNIHDNNHYELYMLLGSLPLFLTFCSGCLCLTRHNNLHLRWTLDTLAMPYRRRHIKDGSRGFAPAPATTPRRIVASQRSS